MDTLSSSVSSLKVPTLIHSNTGSRELTYINTNNTTSYYSSNKLLCSKPNNKSSITSYKPATSLTTQKHTFTRTSLLPSSSSQTLHRNAATGYAVALIDIAQHKNSLDLVAKDVERLLKLLRHEKVQELLGSLRIGEREKERAVLDVAEKGSFNRHLMCLVRMLVGKNKLGIVRQVLEEFERVYDEIMGTQVVLVSSASKMREDQILGITKRVQTLSGALKVKVKNFVCEDSLACRV